jgi:SAM-dependent methyltransferase
VLEAGCGLGQYVRLLCERGGKAIGIDWSTDALATAHRASAMPLATMALTAMASYVSLGVVEHDPAGPDAILAEARRVLATGGTLVISVPYVNGLRRLGAPWIRRQSRAAEAAGEKFYQYAFTRAELLAALGRHSLTPLAVHPYDPARVLRKLRPRGRRTSAGRHDSGAYEDAPPASQSRRSRGPISRIMRKAPYTDPALGLQGHMLLVVARRA